MNELKLKRLCVIREYNKSSLRMDCHDGFDISSYHKNVSEYMNRFGGKVIYQTSGQRDFNWYLISVSE